MKTFTLINGYDRKKKEKMLFRYMTKEEILNLSYGNRVWFLANDGTARQLKINGKVRTWKRDTDRIEVPVKYGMYEYGQLNLTQALSPLLIRVLRIIQDTKEN